MNMLDFDDLNALAERVEVFSHQDFDDLLEAWGFDVEGLQKFMAKYTRVAAKSTAGLDPVSALAVAWFSGFELGYLARIEVESRELLSVPEALPE